MATNTTKNKSKNKKSGGGGAWAPFGSGVVAPAPAPAPGSFGNGLGVYQSPEAHAAYAAMIEAALANQGGGDSGGYDVSGYEAPQTYEPDPALLWALQQLDAQFGRLDEAGNKGRAAIGDAEKQWLERLATLQTNQQADLARSAEIMRGDNANAEKNYTASVDPILRDLMAQGAPTSPIQQQATLDKQRFADYGNRQNDLTQRFAQIQRDSFADRQAAAAGQMAGARGILENTIVGNRAELDKQKADLLFQIADSMKGYGSGGGGGRGGGGGGSSSVPLGVLDALAAANSDLADPRQGISYGGRNQGMVNRFINSIDPSVNNLGGQWLRFKRTARKQGLNTGGFLKQVKKNVVIPLKKSIPAYQKAQAVQNKARTKVQLWGSL